MSYEDPNKAVEDVTKKAAPIAKAAEEGVTKAVKAVNENPSVKEAKKAVKDAAKEVNVENHVLRYWEEELHLPIKRNELGHRYYTKEDVERFKQIKSMKERGLQLKAIKMILKNGKIDILSGQQEL